MLFDSFEAYDVQETRRVSEICGKEKHSIEDIPFYNVFLECRDGVPAWMEKDCT